MSASSGADAIADSSTSTVTTNARPSSVLHPMRYEKDASPRHVIGQRRATGEHRAGPYSSGPGAYAREIGKPHQPVEPPPLQRFEERAAALVRIGEIDSLEQLVKDGVNDRLISLCPGKMNVRVAASDTIERVFETFVRKAVASSFAKWGPKPSPSSQ